MPAPKVAVVCNRLFPSHCVGIYGRAVLPLKSTT